MVMLKNLQARLHREVPSSYKHMTVYGTQELTTFICVVCKEKGYLSEAYLASKSKRKHPSDIRPYHASCYIKTNGRISTDKEPSATLINLLWKDYD